MFTGLVEVKGSIHQRTPRGRGARITIKAPFFDLVLGESIAVDGACLTVNERQSGSFEVDASSETLDRTTLGSLSLGAEVNLERAIPAGGRMGGHIVTGHVDGTTTLRGRHPSGDAIEYVFACPAEWSPLVAPKGSICINGVSLTVNAVDRGGICVTLIPHTLRITNLSSLSVGETVNVELDIVARYVARWLGANPSGTATDWTERLKQAGYE